MRYYAINLLRIESPYAFSALGSAIAFPVSVYNTLGGLTAKKSGEDFYFLQKLRKFGKLVTWNSEKVYPASRFSDRVFFGTGPAMIKGNEGDWESYPIYNYRLFDKISQTYKAFPKLYKEDFDVPLSKFISNCFKDENIWKSLRINARDEEHFIKACQDKIDGLRILQFLKNEQKAEINSDEFVLKEFLETFHSNVLNKEISEILNELNFKVTSIQNLDIIRNLLVEIEEHSQKNN
jgi:hypothetical protein